MKTIETCAVSGQVRSQELQQAQSDDLTGYTASGEWGLLGSELFPPNIGGPISFRQLLTRSTDPF